MGIENHIISLFGLAASWFLVTGLIWKLFDRIEKVATDEAKEKTNTWLHNVNPGERLHYLSDMFGNSFDSVFGEKHISWKCFFRSSVASVLSAIAVLFLWVGINPVEGGGIHGGTIVLFAMFIGMINLIPDYISLLQSRLVVKYIKNNNKNAMILVIVDFLLTVVIATFAWVFLLVLTAVVDDSEIISFSEFKELLYTLISLGEANNGFPLGILFYSTFFTSIWLWLYLVSGVLSQFANSANNTSNFVKRYLVKEEQPFISLGAISILLVTGLYILTIPIVLTIE